ncbi:hypothetical protein JVU11DRAFT_12224 [Chiua virens]|nr:hypothetical protein JVU11DRAFT_12224 [Chiua virens]
MSTHETSQKTSQKLAEKAKGCPRRSRYVLSYRSKEEEHKSLCSPTLTGATESIFGSMRGAIHGEGAKAKDEETVAKGRAEVERGFAQMRGEPAPGTTAGAESQAGGKDAQPPPPAEKQEGTIPASPEAAHQQESAAQAEGKGAQPQQPAGKQEGTIPAPPEAAGRQESVGQADPGMAQKGSQGTQQEGPSAWMSLINVLSLMAVSPAVPKKPLGAECLIGKGADAPQGPGSCIY